MSYRVTTIKVLLMFGLFVLLPAGVWAQGMGAQPGGNFYNAEPRPQASNQVGEKVLSEVGWTQNLNQQIPLDLTFRDDAGKQVTLQKYFGKKPVLVEMVFFYCPMLCTEVLRGTFQGLKDTPFKAGQDYEMLVISINPKEGSELAAEKKAGYLKDFGMENQADGIHFLTGKEKEIEQLSKAIGFGYVYDASTDQFAHPAGLVMSTPEGKVARYMSGVIFEPKDLRLGFLDAGQGKIGSPLDLIVLKCYRYDGQTGQYTFAVMNVIRIAGLATVILVGLLMVVLVRRDMVRSKRSGDDL